MLAEVTPTVMIPTTRPDEARRFYEQVMGLTLDHDNGFAIVLRSGAAQVFLQRMEAHTPRPGTMVGWSVPDVRAERARLAAAGAVFEQFPGMEQDEHGIWVPPGGAGGVCWFKDPDGNLLSISQAT